MSKPARQAVLDDFFSGRVAGSRKADSGGPVNNRFDDDYLSLESEDDIPLMDRYAELGRCHNAGSH